MHKQQAEDILVNAMGKRYQRLIEDPTDEQEQALHALQGSTDIAPGYVWDEVRGGWSNDELTERFGVTGSTWSDVVAIIREEIGLNLRLQIERG